MVRPWHAGRGNNTRKALGGCLEDWRARLLPASHLLQLTHGSVHACPQPPQPCSNEHLCRSFHAACRSRDGLAAALGPDFELVQEADLPCAQRSCERMYSVAVMHASVWRRVA